VHEQMNLAVDGHSHFGGDDIVLGVGIVVGVQAIEILIGLTDHVGMNGSKRSVRTGVAKVKSELSSLDLDRNRISAGRSEVGVRPGFHAKNSEGQNLSTYQKNRRPDHSLCAAGEGFDLFPRAGI